MVSNEAAVSAVGIAPIRNVPDSPSRIFDRSWRRASASARIRWAHSSIRSPSGVSPAKRRPRRTRGTSSSRSSLRMAADSEGWET
ncbi:hypothetical protein ACIBO5_47545 [Nonomuraea angiospora]|uniref:hypothetical protein n=1 Tax=Nonomuraea angiospora TaxID=46172 RepID=UPI0029A4A395|nr:hypothetical protein [Nonomuraea angiospora]MDX3107689.1 hypothetical protein [Nonomuraea angiospora]